MEQVKDALRSLTQTVCNQLKGIETPRRNLWTVVESPDEPPHVAMDVDRSVPSELIFSLSFGLSKLPEYKAVAQTIESDPELGKGVIIDAGESHQHQ